MMNFHITEALLLDRIWLNYQRALAIYPDSGLKHYVINYNVLFNNKYIKIFMRHNIVITRCLAILYLSLSKSNVGL